MSTIRICFVCLGNICRSPTAEAVFRHVVEAEGLGDALVTESAGTGSWHVGEKPDARARQAAKRRGVSLRGRARQVTPEDFDRFDYLVAMDGPNLDALLGMAPGGRAKAKARLFRSYDPGSPVGAEVPDPYYGGEGGFDEVLDICEAAARGLLAHLRRAHGI